MKSKKKKNRKRLIALIVILALACAGGAVYIKKKNGGDKEVKYKTAVVERGRVMATVSGSGAVQPVTTVDVKSNVGGQIVLLAVDEGDAVEAGQLIAKIDPADAQNALEQQQANYDAAVSKVSQAKENLAMQRLQTGANVASAENALKSAKARLEQAEEALKAQPELTETAITQARANFDFAGKELARQRDLLAKGFVSKSAADSAQQKYDVAKAQLDGANANAIQIKLKRMDVESARASVKQSEAALASAKAGLMQINIREGDITQARAQTVSSSAGVTNAKNQLGYTTILAPRAGVIVKKYVEQGSIVTGGRSAISGTGAGVSIVQIADTTRMQAVVNIDETDIGRIEVGQFVRVSLDAYPDERFRGKVVKIAPQAVVNQNVTTVPVTVDIMNADERVKPGLNANCDFIIGRKRDVLVVPNEALKDGPRGGKIVMVMGKDKTKKPDPRKVETGLQGDDGTEIISGLKEGEVVVTGEEAPVDPNAAAGMGGGAGGGAGGQGGNGGRGGASGSGGGRGGGGRGGMRGGPRMF